MAAWPAYARIAGAMGAGWRPDARRTGWDDGAVRQERIGVRPTLRREVTAIVDQADLPSWILWLEAHAHDRIEWTDPMDGVRRWARVEGGLGGVAMRQINSRGTQCWECSMALEGHRDDVVPAPPGGGG